MRSLILVCLVAMIHVISSEELYITPNDTFDFGALSTEQMQHQIDCMLDQGPCDDMGASQRQDGPEAIRTECAKCSKDLKRSFLVFLTRMKNEFPAEYELYVAKYDPEGIHMDHLLAELSKH